MEVFLCSINWNTCNCYQTVAQENRACKDNLSVNIKRLLRNGNVISVWADVWSQTNNRHLKYFSVLSPTSIPWGTRSIEALQMGWWSQNNNPKPQPPRPFSLKQHNHTIKALLPFSHCLISAGYLRYLCGCSYLWPSACCFVVTLPTPSAHLPAPTPHTSVLRPSEGCHYSLTHLTIPSCGMCICRIAADLHSMGWGEVLTEIWLDTLYQMGKDEDETAAGAVVSNLAVIE